MRVNSNSRKERQAENVTGRDGYIICKALAYAIETIERLPEERQEKSDKSDMEKLFNHLARGDADFILHMLDQARAHITGVGWLTQDSDGAWLVGRPDGNVVLIRVEQA